MSDALARLQQELEAAQRALADAEARYASRENASRKIEQAHHEWMVALDVVEDPVFLHDRKFRILRCNKAYQRNAGMPFRDIIGRPYYEIFPKTGAPLAGCLRAMEMANTAVDEEEIVVGSATYRSRNYSVYGEQGDYLHSVHILEDITERKQVENDLRESENLLRSIVENAPVRVFWKNHDLRYLGCNTLFAKDAGYSSPDELAGKSDFEMGWRDQAELYRSDDRSVMDSGNAKLDYEEPQTTPDGNTIWLRTSKVPLRDINNQVIGILGIYQDITERKLAEDRLRESEAFTKAVLDNLPVGIAVNSVGHSVTFSYVNDNFPKLYRTTRDKLEDPDAFWDVVYEDAEFRQKIRERVLEDCASGDVERMHWDDVPITRQGEDITYISARNIPVPDKQLMISMVWDVTKRRRAEIALKESERIKSNLLEKLNQAQHLANIGSWEWDLLANQVWWSDESYRIFGLTPQDHVPDFEEIAGFIHPDDLDEYRVTVDHSLQTGEPLDIDLSLVIGGGSLKYCHAKGEVIHDDSGRPVRFIGTIMDITERRQAELILHESEERYRTLFKTMLNGFAHCRMLYEDGRPCDFVYLDVNDAFEKQTGLKGVIGKRVSEIIPGILEADPELVEIYGRVASGGHPEQFEIYVDALKMWFFVSVYSPKPEHFVAVFDVITERKHAEEALKNEALRRRVLMEGSLDGIAIFNQQHQVVEANSRFAEMLGYTPEEILDLHTWDFEATMTEAQIRSSFADFMNTGMVIETRHRRKDGTVYDAEVSIGGAMVDVEPMIFTISRDITGRKQAEKALHRLNRALMTLSTGNQVLVQAASEDELLRSVTSVIVEQGGYSLAVVDYAEDDPQKSISPRSWSGFDGDRYWADNLCWDDNERGQLPASRAIRSGTTQVCHDISSDSSFDPWREAVQSLGYRANTGLPLRSDGNVFGSLSIYASEPDAFDDEEILLLEELANDLAYGIATLRTRKAHEQHAIIMRQSLEQSIETIADTVEARDPYTAGHQRRVADLARAIAQAMGLPDDQTHGIHLAATVHDLGKIRIPAEILSKPGRLNEIEYLLIKQHPQEGYNILKNVKFPWPIADIILQHHERLDGSGYPQGLRGDDILLEARIMAVADVVEAMSSHRPYRAGLGIDAALNEIIRMRGTHYDAHVVDACVALFREKEYAIPG